MQTFYPTPGHRVDYFDELDEFLQHVSQKHLEELVQLPGHSESQKAELRLMRHGDRRSHQQWAGGLTHAEAHKMASEGAYVDPALLELRERLNSAIRPAPEQECFWDVQGSSMIDMGSFLSGQPECVLNYTEASSRSRKPLRLIYNASVSCGVDVNSLKFRGVGFLALLDALEASKLYRTEVYYVCCEGRNRNDPSYSIVIRVKDMGRPYDPQAIGFALSHPTMFRRLCFAGFNTLSDADQRFHGVSFGQAYGTPCTMSALPSEVVGETPSNDVVLESGFLGDAVNTSEVYDEATALEWVRRQLANYNITVEA